MNNSSNEKYKQPIYHQAHYVQASPSPQHPPIHYIDPQYTQYVPSNAQRKSYLQRNQYGVPNVIKTNSMDEITLSAANSLQYPTPTTTPNSSLGGIAQSPYHQNIIDTHSAHSNTHSNLLPSIKYYCNQHSNTSNNSSSTYLSSTTNQSNNTSSGYSALGSMPSIQPVLDITAQSHSHGPSDIQQMPVHYHPYDAPMYHYQHSHDLSTSSSYPPQMLARSSTPNINIMELDQMATVIKTDDDEKKHDSHRGIEDTARTKHQRRTTKHLELKNFNGDIRAYNIWIGCIQSNQNVIFFYMLYPKLCEYLMDIVGSSRCPTPNDLHNAFIVHGAEANKYKNDRRHAYLSINKTCFYSFWNWFKNCCLVVKDLRYLWDNNDYIQSKRKCVHGLGLNFFCQRARCEANLLQSAEGTFALRLSSSVNGGVVLSYVEHIYSDINRKKVCKHVILIRQKSGMYLCNKKVLSLHDIIRNFVKLKFLYTPHRVIAKNKIF